MLNKMCTHDVRPSDSVRAFGLDGKNHAVLSSHSMTLVFDSVRAFGVTAWWLKYQDISGASVG
jgi:hypothetical protein